MPPLSRREFLASSAALLAARALPAFTHESTPTVVNDIHSQLNPTRVSTILQPRSLADVQHIVRAAHKKNQPIAISGGRHAMGGQQFCVDTPLIDIRQLNQILHLDRETGILEVEAGIEWPQLIDGYLALQNAGSSIAPANTTRATWGISQKQTGADRFTISGTMAANAHGRALTKKPFISDLESFVLVDHAGEARTCSRTENPELFRLIIGGYGLFGVVTSARLRLIPRKKVERIVEIRTVDELIPAIDKRIADGFEYGDFQFSIERDSDDFMHKGVFACYRPVPLDTPIPSTEKQLTDANWRQLLSLAHSDQKKAFDTYASYYLSTSGQIYWSDLHQLSIYPDNYHREIDTQTHAPHPATEVIAEIDVPRPALTGFFNEAREDFRKNKVDLIYGTVRLIERDDESFLPWAKQNYACTIFNLHTVHTPEGIARTNDAFSRLIDMAARRGGSFYLTYAHAASRAQLLSCYPQFPEFLRLKEKYDPESRFQSNWYRFTKSLLSA